jgi:hypothetical protein
MQLKGGPMIMARKNREKARQNQLPVAKSEDVEYSEELADAEDIEAGQRAEAADQRQEGK